MLYVLVSTTTRYVVSLSSFLSPQLPVPPGHSSHVPPTFFTFRFLFFIPALYPHALALALGAL